MYVRVEALLKVTWKDKRYKWFRVGKWRKTASIVSFFRGKSDFYYAKLYEFDRETRTAGRELGAFGGNYTKGIFN